ncbi:hypothetical protein AGRA3207_002201 [Actinomadura graeca]|uniref:Phosphotriesterase n=1 Tax=Actinomadura graeca TaxID=2750812 RepID=A0ABX8QRC7_9ACTN|nr:hypothetical protein [Actinomadura graeca]QXJ21355.1 hypothetical protein AGRA3207_002201 [Actinomadura graeca]
MPTIHTVLGDIDPAQAGITLTHEHIVYANPGCEFDHQTVYDVEEVASEVGELLNGALGTYGIQTMVDLTPIEVGRNPLLLKATAEKTGVHIIGTTGFFPERIGIPYHFRKQDIGYLKDFFIRDLTEGMASANQRTSVRAGIIKVATGSGDGHEGMTPLQPSGLRVTALEERIVRAAGRAQAETGCPINTHTEPADYAVTNPGIEQLDLLEAEGADPAKILIGHALVKPDIEQLSEICRRGANLQIDHIGIPWRNTSAEQLDDLMARHIAELADRGYLEQMTFSYDRFFRHARGPVDELEPDMLNERVDLDHLFESFVPRLAKYGFDDAAVRQVLVVNPAKYLAF